MMFHRLKSINKNQRGFTLIELIIAIAIAGFITGGIVTTITQVFDTNSRSSNHMTAVRQVQNAGYWISHDAQMAQSVELADPDPDGFPLTLTWIEWDGTTNEVRYTLLVNDKLQREHYINYDPVTNPNPDSTIFVAEYIDPDPTKTNCYEDADGVLIFTVTVEVGSGSPQVRSETRVYEVIPRPSV